MPKRKTPRPSLSASLSPDFFKALADPNRVAILAQLARSHRSQTVSDVARRCPIDLSVVSRHLKILRAAGILESEKRGKLVFYRVRRPYLVALFRDLADALDAPSPPRSRPAPRKTALSNGGSRT